jgi:hypothetical protein
MADDNDPDLRGQIEALRQAFVILTNSLEPAHRARIKGRLKALMPAESDPDNPWRDGRWEMMDYLVRHIGR